MGDIHTARANLLSFAQAKFALTIGGLLEYLEEWIVSFSACNKKWIP